MLIPAEADCFHEKIQAAIAERDRLRRVNAELWAALNEIYKMLPPYKGHGRMDSEIEAARAAIAKAEEVQSWPQR